MKRHTQPQAKPVRKELQSYTHDRGERRAIADLIDLIPILSIVSLGAKVCFETFSPGMDNPKAVRF